MTVERPCYQTRSIRWNLTASGPRPNPQGSYHYGLIKPSRTIILANSAPYINGKQRYAINGVSYVDPDTPLKLADYFKIGGVLNLGGISDQPYNGNGYLGTPVMAANFRSYVEIVFQIGRTLSSHGTLMAILYLLSVYPKSWTAIYMALDNVGMWNIRSEDWSRRYLGQ
uniref:L-ascorbate oxidase homolog n=1 Tax=Nicotiana tabacum TaxID=4097 RepID=A0A1S4A3R2_TOBAC|nr:PREDICTED: L-ascorbate oxidase homolog [Nicotiana tabacum]